MHKKFAMKNTLLFILLFCILHAQAENGHTASCVFKVYKPAAQTDNIDNLQKQLRKFRRKRAVGIGMMGAGAGLFLIGQVMLWTSVGLNAAGKRNYDDSSQDPLWDAGFVGTTVGAGLLGGGIPLYLFSDRRARAFKKRINAQRSGESDIIIIK
jgi:hypothetical protein